MNQVSEFVCPRAISQVFGYFLFANWVRNLGSKSCFDDGNDNDDDRRQRQTVKRHYCAFRSAGVRKQPTFKGDEFPSQHEPATTAAASTPTPAAPNEPAAVLANAANDANAAGACRGFSVENIDANDERQEQSEEAAISTSRLLDC